MIQPSHHSDARLGFLTVVENPDVGFSGGLLIVAANGRPVEFHCTASVQINRAQKILYGKTYQSFLFCDQIGQSLIEKARIQPRVFLTDQVDMLPLADAVDSPVLLLQHEEPQDDDAEMLQTDRADGDVRNLHHQPQLHGTPLANFRIPTRQLWFESALAEQANPMQEVCERFSRTLPLDEPLERIRQAISEAQAVSR